MYVAHMALPGDFLAPFRPSLTLTLVLFGSASCASSPLLPVIWDASLSPLVSSSHAVSPGMHPSCAFLPHLPSCTLPPPRRETRTTATSTRYRTSWCHPHPMAAQHSLDRDTRPTGGIHDASRKLSATAARLRIHAGCRTRSTSPLDMSACMRRH